MSKFKGLIFDVDGTLTSTNQLIFDSFNHITEKYLNRTYTDKEIVAFFGPTENVIIMDLMKDNYEEARKDYFEFYRNNHKRLADTYPGIYELINTLSGKTLLSVYTGKGRDSMVITLQETGIHDHFDMVVSGDDIEGHKPSPEGINLFLDKFNLAPEEVLMIGDAPADQIAARDAGCKVASVLWDSYAKDNGFWKESDYAFHSVEELSAFLLDSI
ncbi:MAG: HAD family hydrolase [Bacteroidetes bacterium]|nr:HAD family hydrolase [Bacteroidota bacterium]